MKIKSKPIWYMIGILFISGLIVAFTIDKSIKEKSEKQQEIVEELKESMEDKYRIQITKSMAHYDTKMGYGAVFTTQDGIQFSAAKQHDEVIDTYMEEWWSKKGLEKWGNADSYIPNIGKVNLYVGYRNEAKKPTTQLSKKLEDVKDELWLSLYIDLTVPYKMENAERVEQGIYEYFHFLQQNQGDDIELIVRHKEDSGSYMIIRDESGKLPEIQSKADVSTTLER